MTSSLLAEQCFDLAEVALLVLDGSGLVVRANPKADQVFRCETGELAGASWFEALGLPDNTAALRAWYNGVLAGEASLPESFQTELLTRSGELKVIRWTLGVPFDTGGTMGVVASGVDVTEPMIAQRQLELVYQHIENLVDERAREAEAAMQRFLTHMAHELRTPLNAILGFAQLLLLDGELSIRSRDQVDSILKAGEGLRTLLNKRASASQTKGAWSPVRSAAKAEPSVPPPSAGSPPQEWVEAFGKALSAGSVTELRLVGGRAAEFDPVLAQWIVDKASHYELDALRRLLQAGEKE